MGFSSNILEQRYKKNSKIKQLFGIFYIFAEENLDGEIPASY